MKRCDNCGLEQSDDTLFCEECGVRLVSIGSGVPAPMPSAGSDVVAESSSEEPVGSVHEPKDEGGAETVAEVVAVSAAAEGKPAEKPEEPAKVSAMAPPTDRFSSTDQSIGRPEQPMPAEQDAPAEHHEQPAPEERKIPIETPEEQEEAPAKQPGQSVSTEQSEQPVEQEDILVEQILSQQQSKPKKKSNHKALKISLVIACLLVVILAVAGIFIANSGLGNKNKSGGSTNTNANTSQQAPADTTSAKDETTITIDGWEFSIPNDYEYEYQDDNLVIFDSDGLWALRIGYDEADYDKVVLNMDALKQKIESNGYKVTKYGIDDFGGTEYYWFDVDISTTGDMGVMALTQAPDQGIFKVTLVDTDNKQNHKYLESVSDILSTAVKVSDSQSSVSR